jgi:MFS family permease
MSSVVPNARDLTFRYERWRAAAMGVFETASSTFLLLIAVQYFQTGATAKALLATGGSAGLILSPFVVSWVTSLGWRASKAAAALGVVGGMSLLAAAAFPVLSMFVTGSVLAMICIASAVPLLTQMYQDNYEEKERGRLFSQAIMIRIAIAAAFSELAGRALTGHPERFRWLLLIFAGALLFSSYCLSRCPSRPLVSDGGTHWLRSMRFVRDDSVFRLTLISWMLMGIGNLMMLPLRVEYLANPRYGLALQASMVALLTGVIPNLARLCLSPLWGKLFDQINFFLLRIILNLGFALGILTFFTGDSMTGLVIGSLIFGVSLAGGDVAWSLWVTKLAPPDRVAEYMAVHTFLTGVRGVLAPLLAFYLIAIVPFHWIAISSGVLIAISCLLLVPEAKIARRRRPATPLVEEVSE